ncbi:unnamed protein product [Penicillium bialowiezense]
MATERKPLALTDLPLELLWMISENLPPADLACLALCNHRLLHCLAGTAFKNFSNGRSRTPNSTDDARIELLSRLSRDLPQYYLCFICLRLHLWKNVRVPNSYSPNHNRQDDFDRFAHSHVMFELPVYSYPSCCYYNFHFVHLQLAMRRFYHGPKYGIPVESFLYTEVKAAKLNTKGLSFLPPVKKKSEGEANQDFMLTLFSAEARICSTPPGLCLRTQDIAVVSRQNVTDIWPGSRYALMKICKHIHTEGLWLRELLAWQIKRHCSTTGTQVSTHEGSCGECNTSWKIDIRNLDATHASLTLTRWMDLGPGLSIEDVEWKYRLDFVMENPEQRTLVDSRQRFERDSIQAGSPDALSEEAMYSRNVALLREKAYRTSMNYAGRGIYILHGEPKAKTKTPMSDPIPLSCAQVELVTSVGTWLSPVAGAIATVLMAHVLGAFSKKPNPPSPPDLERGISGELTGGGNTNGFLFRLLMLSRRMVSDQKKIFSSQDEIISTQVKMQRQIDSLIERG